MNTSQDVFIDFANTQLLYRLWWNICDNHSNCNDHFHAENICLQSRHFLFKVNIGAAEKLPPTPIHAASLEFRTPPRQSPPKHPWWHTAGCGLLLQVVSPATPRQVVRCLSSSLSPSPQPHTYFTHTSKSRHRVNPSLWCVFRVLTLLDMNDALLILSPALNAFALLIC